MPVMGKKMAVAQDSYGSYQHDNQRIYYPCSVYGRGFWPAAGTIADDNTDSTLAYDIWLNDSSSAENYYSLPELQLSLVFKVFYGRFL